MSDHGWFAGRQLIEDCMVKEMDKILTKYLGLKKIFIGKGSFEHCTVGN